MLTIFIPKEVDEKFLYSCPYEILKCHVLHSCNYCATTSDNKLLENQTSS
jgi:hypothetical protein